MYKMSVGAFVWSSFGVYMFKILPVSLRVKSYLFVFQLFYKSRVSLLYIIYSLILVALPILRFMYFVLDVCLYPVQPNM